MPDILKNMMTNDVVKLQALSWIMLLASNLFAAIAIYLDCRLCNIKRTWLFTVLTAIFGVSAGALYFIVRRWLKQEVPTVCAKCGKKIRKGEKVCPKCGASYFIPRSIENRSEITTKVAVCIVLAILMLGVRTWVTEYSPLAQSADQQLSQEYSDLDEYGETDDTEDFEYSVFD